MVQRKSKNNPDPTLGNVDKITRDHFTINATSEFQTYLQDFEETFEVKCIRIHHQKIIIREECVDDIWKFPLKVIMICRTKYNMHNN